MSTNRVRGAVRSVPGSLCREQHPALNQNSTGGLACKDSHTQQKPNCFNKLLVVTMVT